MRGLHQEVGWSCSHFHQPYAAEVRTARVLVLVLVLVAQRHRRKAGEGQRLVEVGSPLDCREQGYRRSGCRLSRLGAGGNSCCLGSSGGQPWVELPGLSAGKAGMVLGHKILHKDHGGRCRHALIRPLVRVNISR